MCSASRSKKITPLRERSAPPQPEVMGEVTDQWLPFFSSNVVVLDGTYRWTGHSLARAAATVFARCRSEMSCCKFVRVVAELRALLWWNRVLTRKWREPLHLLPQVRCGQLNGAVRPLLKILERLREPEPSNRNCPAQCPKGNIGTRLDDPSSLTELIRPTGVPKNKILVAIVTNGRSLSDSICCFPSMRSGRGSMLSRCFSLD